MPSSIESPGRSVLGQALAAAATLPVPGADGSLPREGAGASTERIAAGLLISMALGEIAPDLDLKAVALLGAASAAGLARIASEEPGLHDTAAAMRALEDLLHRTAEGSR